MKRCRRCSPSLWLREPRPRQPSRPGLRQTFCHTYTPEDIPPRDVLYGGHYARGLLSADVAPGGFGKTVLKVGEMLTMTTGRPLLGYAVRRPLRVWYINLEDSMEELQRRVTTACKRWGN